MALLVTSPHRFVFVYHRLAAAAQGCSPRIKVPGVCRGIRFTRSLSYQPQHVSHESNPWMVTYTRNRVVEPNRIWCCSLLPWFVVTVHPPPLGDSARVTSSPATYGWRRLSRVGKQDPESSIRSVAVPCCFPVQQAGGAEIRGAGRGRGKVAGPGKTCELRIEGLLQHSGG